MLSKEGRTGATIEDVGKKAFDIQIDRVAFSLGLAVFLVGLAIRLVGIGWGLPTPERTSSLHPDEPVVLG